ncbi:oxidoreductase [Parafrankia sp. FMc2]|uniref:oxidoreductase n=1 Tax=Parafrankia sp. FMc2 TaxID=3233196 RepID=UPI0034D48EB8
MRAVHATGEPGDTPPAQAPAEGAASPAAAASLLLGALAELLTGLDTQQVTDLLEGRARLAVVPGTPGGPAGSARPEHDPVPADPVRPALPPPTGTARAQPPAGSAGGLATGVRRRSRAAERGPGRSRPELPSGPALEELRRSLRAAPSRGAAEQILDGLGPFTVVALRELAAGLGVTGVGSRDPRPAVRRKIVDGTVGQRLRTEAIFGGGF